MKKEYEMPYLFERDIEANIKAKFKPAEAEHLQGEYPRITNSLRQKYPRTDGYLAGDPTAAALAKKMGMQESGPAGSPHASQYCDWRVISQNAQTVYGRVSDELGVAYNLGLDIRNEKVVGKMYQLAAEIFSTFGKYSGYAQYEGRS